MSNFNPQSISCRESLHANNYKSYGLKAKEYYSQGWG